MAILRPNPAGDRPQVASTAYIDPAAHIIGNVRIGPGVYVGPGAVIRADEPGQDGAVVRVEIGQDCNVQDNVIIHALGETGVNIGPRTSLSHGCVVHGPCTVAGNCFIGFRAIVFDAHLADGVFVGHGAVVNRVRLSAHTSVPNGASISTYDQALALGETNPSEKAFIEKVVRTNIALAKAYRLQNMS